MTIERGFFPNKLQPTLLPLVLLTALGGISLAYAQRSIPNVEIAKQSLNRKWLKLKPDSVAERTVLFQEVIPGQPEAGGSTFPFRVTVLIHDYEKGYPPNRYYGRTCVSRIEQEVYRLEPDSFGGWDAQGRMTPNMSDTRCQNNPSDGVSSIPLSSLSGSRAASGPIAPGVAATASSGPAGGGGVAPGSYQCWGNGQPHPFMDFTVRAGNQYSGGDGKTGTFSFDPSTQRITFRGGSLDGVLPAGFYDIYHSPQGRPVVSFRNSSGSEATYCEHK